MKRVTILLAALAVTACQSPVANYAEMSEEQQARFMKSYEDDMNKVHSLANRAGQIVTTYTADPVEDSIDVKMVFGMDLPRATSQQMSKEMGQALLQSDCTSWVYSDFIEAGISYRVKAVDSKGRTIFRQNLSPKTCAPYRDPAA